MPELIKLYQSLAKETACNLRTNVSGRKLTTFAIGGEVQVFTPENEATLSNLLKALQRHNLEFQIIGAGSNLLIPDEGLGRPVIMLGRGFDTFEINQKQVSIGAGRSLMRTSRETAKSGLAGLEFAGGIPASLGGAVRMNAGAHTGEMSEVISSVEFFMPDGSKQVLGKEKIDFSYRTTSLPKEALVTKVHCQLIPGDKDIIFAKQQSNLTYRKETQPLQLASAGSIFRNIKKKSETIYAGQLIEEAGLKDLALGGAKVSDLHANWIVNPKKTAAAADVVSLISQVQSKVEKQTDHRLQAELVVLS